MFIATRGGHPHIAFIGKVYRLERICLASKLILFVRHVHRPLV